MSNLSTQLDPKARTKGYLHPQNISTESFSLLVVEGPDQGKSLRLTQQHMHIGRGAWCDLILLQDPQVSKEHCTLRLDSQGLRITDLKSRNGVFLDEVRILEAYLDASHTLRLGANKLRLQSHHTTQQVELPVFDKSHHLVGQSEDMRKLFALLARLGPKDVPVLFTGETGTGKTSMARALHAQSPRSHQPFVVVNCGAITPSLAEATLFGYEKGAFTGAQKRHRGFFEQAHQGTLFLDEIGELPLSLQPKLLDVLERGRVQRLGSEQEYPVDVRIIASTHRHLPQEVSSGHFREDLYYRLAVVILDIPPLRERPQDIPLLLEWLCQQLNAPNLLFTDAAIQKLQRHLWPGNVRQLRNVLHRLIALHHNTEDPQQESIIDAQNLELPQVLTQEPLPQTQQQTPPSVGPQGAFSSLKEMLGAIEKRTLLETLLATGWDTAKAAQQLQISRVWLYNRIKKYELNEHRPEEAKPRKP